MKKISSINAYDKNGKKFVVIKCGNDTYSINIGLINYALNNIKKVKEAK